MQKRPFRSFRSKSDLAIRSGDLDFVQYRCISTTEWRLRDIFDDFVLLRRVTLWLWTLLWRHAHVIPSSDCAPTQQRLGRNDYGHRSAHLSGAGGWRLWLAKTARTFHGRNILFWLKQNSFDFFSVSFQIYFSCVVTCNLNLTRSAIRNQWRSLPWRNVVGPPGSKYQAGGDIYNWLQPIMKLDGHAGVPV